ncbi:hypothetical protein MJG53_000362 [Ovis ammon polii x Ovis aries]|nr:hypothetical protein MJG53_000362 [Ovis ammon polii x Ovis aries]
MRDTAATTMEESARACPHSKRGLTPLGRLQKYSKIHVSTGEESSGSGPDSTQGLRPRHRRKRNPERPPWKSYGDWPFLRLPERVPEGPVVSREHLPQLEKIQEVLPSRRDEAHFRERIPDVPVASQEEALSTGKARGTPGSCHHSKSPPDVSVHSRGTCFPCTALTFKPRIESHHVCTWDSPVGKPRGKGKRNSRVVPPFLESPRCVSPFQRNLFSLHCLDVQAEDRLPPRMHVGQPCGKASRESLVGKTRGKTIGPLIHAADCVTLLLLLWRKAQVHARIRDED